MIKLLTILLMLPLLCCSKEQIELTLIGGKITKGAKEGKIYDIDILTVTGFRSKEDIITVINDGELSLNKIYNEFLDKKSNFSGKILLKFAIAENGSITNADIVHSTTEYAEFDEAIKNKIVAYKWKAIKGDNSVLTIVFTFRSDKSNRGHYDPRDLLVSGSRSMAEIVHFVDANMPGLRNLYNEYFKLRPNFEGKVIIKFTIAKNGEVTNADIVHSTTEYVEFDEAIRKEISTWKWKLIKKGNATVTAILYFTE